MEVSAGTAQASLPLTFGQPFRAGDLPSSSGLIATDSNGASVPVQMDEVSSHTDGSVRFAVLSTQLSNLQASQPRIVNLFKAAKSASTPSVPADPAWNLQLEATIYDSNGNGTVWTAQPQSQLRDQIASGAGRRLSGGVASEYTIVAPFKSSGGAVHPHLEARLHVRLYENGTRIRTEAVLENTRTFTSGPGNITYQLVIKQGGTVVHTQPKFTHYHHARWRKVVWTGSQPQFRLRHHMPYVLASRALLNYDLSLKVPEQTLASWDINMANVTPMQAGVITQYFPMTGGRADIGPLPRWTATYIVSQDDRPRKAMFLAAEEAAAIPVHYRDEQTGLPLSVVQRPNVTVMFGNSSPQVPAASGSTIWTPDTSHQASFSYVPYLLTGDAFHQDEMMFWASWNVAGGNPEYRGYAKGLLNWDQLRGQAWSLRSLAEAAFALPDNHPMKAYYQGVLRNNLDWYVSNYKPGSTMSALGAIKNPYHDRNTSPWQSDFMGTVLAFIAGQGEAQALTALQEVSKFTVGRFLNDANGFCAAQAGGYYWDWRDSSGAQYTTWRAFYNANYPDKANLPCSNSPDEGYPRLAIGYAAYARGMLAAAANNNVSNASTAYARWKSMTPLMDADLAKDPTWAIKPVN